MRPASAKGAAYYEQDVLRDDGAIISVKQGDAQPVAVLDHKGVDVAGIIGRIGQDAIALAESKTPNCAPHKPTCSASPASETAIKTASLLSMPKQMRCAPKSKP